MFPYYLILFIIFKTLLGSRPGVIEDKDNARKYHNTVARPLLCLKDESTHASRTFLAYEMLALMQRTFTVNSTLLLNVHSGAKAWTGNIKLSYSHWLCYV